MAGLPCLRRLWAGWLVAWGCGAAPTSPSFEPTAWALLGRTLQRSWRLQHLEAEHLVLCPDGGMLQGPGRSAVMLAAAHGEATGLLVWRACGQGGEVLHGQAEVRLVADGQRVRWRALSGQLRRLSDAAGCCQLQLADDGQPADDLSLTGNFCGQAVGWSPWAL